MKTKTTIEIDLEVSKIIFSNSNYFDEPANDVLKRLLNSFSTKQFSKKEEIEDQTFGVTVKGTFFKSGLKLRRHLKGKLLEAIVRNGYIEFNNKKYATPSGAAVAAAGNSVNGWTFWNFLDEKDGKWKSLILLRSKN